MATDSEKPKSVTALGNKKTRNYRFPGETKGVVVQKITTQPLVNRPILYDDPSTWAANKLSKTLEGTALAAIQKRLYDAGYYDSGDIIIDGRRRPEDFAALERALKEANARGETWESAADFRTSMGLAGVTPTSGGSSGGSGAKTSGSMQITGPASARDTFNKLSLKYQGKASGEEFADAYAKLVEAQRAAPIQYATQKIGGKYYSVQVSDGVNADDFFQQYLLNKINFGSDQIGGIAAENVTAVKEFSKLYGTGISDVEMTSFAKGLTDGSMTTNDVRKKLAERAKLKYKAFANDVNETVSVYDLASDYIAAKANTLELNAKSLGVDDVVDAISGDKPMTTSEYIVELKKDPRYQFTNRARTDAAGFATSLATTFGFGA